jgi:hypothetical protein
VKVIDESYDQRALFYVVQSTLIYCSPSLDTAQWELALAAAVGMMNYGQQQVYPAMRCDEGVGLWVSTCMPRGGIDVKIDAAIVA